MNPYVLLNLGEINISRKKEKGNNCFRKERVVSFTQEISSVTLGDSFNLILLFDCIAVHSLHK
jgi:hypothetical protein